MTMRFIHTADIHLGKTYRNSLGETERYENFFRCLLGIVEAAIYSLRFVDYSYGATRDAPGIPLSAHFENGIA